MAKARTKAENDAVLKELGEFYDYASDFWRPIFLEGDTDMRYVSGDPWSTDDRTARKDRPTLSCDEMGQYFNQTINDIRANPIAVKFSPAGNGANDQSAEFYENKQREIEYRSKAQIVYITAFENAVQRSYGFCRVTTRYASDRSTNREIWLEPVPNPSMVLMDPESLHPTGKDAKKLLYLEVRRRSDFVRDFPHAKVTDFDSKYARTMAPSGWITAETVTIGEYWRVEYTRETLLVLMPPAPKRPNLRHLPPGVAVPMPAPPQPVGVFESELTKEQKKWEVIDRRENVDVPHVVQYLTNGVEILKVTPWAGLYIPFVSCFGKVLYLNESGVTTRVILSMTRLARDPQKFLSYAMSQECEMLGMIPKTPVMGYKGQFRGVEQNWQAIPHDPLAYIEALPFVEGMNPNGTPLPLPQRIPYSAGEHLQAIELVKESARRSIQAAMAVSPLPTQAQRQNEKSGVALGKIEQAGQRGSFHFVDHYKDMIEQVGVICEDLMGKIYDTARDVTVRKADNTAAQVRVNDPGAQEGHVSTDGDHLVTIGTGPSRDSERMEANETADQIIGNPQLGQVIGPQKMTKLVGLALKLKAGGPLVDEMAKIVDPPADDSDPQQAMQQLQQLQQENQQLKQVLQQASMEKQAKVVEQQGKFQVVKYQTDAKVQSEAADRAVKLDVAAIEAKIETMAMMMSELQRVGGLKSDAAERLHQAAQQATQHVHDTVEAQKDRGHDLIQAHVAHQQALEAGQQAAALAPQPDPTQAGQ